MAVNKFRDGEVVYVKKYPNTRLVIRYGIDAIYYCRIVDSPGQKELLYFERELLAENDNARKWSND